MPVQFCPRHKIGFNDDFDAVCPQCTLAALEPLDPYEVDQNTGDVKIPADAADKRPKNILTRK